MLAPLAGFSTRTPTSLAIAAVLLIDALAHPWQEAITAGFAVALAYIVHQGSKRNGG